MVGLLAGFDVIILKSALLKAGLTRLFSQLTRLLRESVGNKDKAVWGALVRSCTLVVLLCWPFRNDVDSVGL